MFKFVRDFLTSGFSFSSNEHLLGFRFAFFNATIALVSLIILCFSIYRFSVSNLVVGFIDLTYSTVLMLTILQLRKNKSSYERLSQFIITLTFITLVTVTVASNEVQILSWYILYVIMAFIMGSWRAGLTGYVASSVTMATFATLRPDTFPPMTVFTLLSINSIIAFMIFCYDRRVYHDHKWLDRYNNRLIHREHETLRMLGKLAEYKDPETGTHIARVSEYSRLLAQISGLDEDMVDTIYYAAPFHDIGKVGIADSIMLKNGKLDDDELAIMKTHTTIGMALLEGADSIYLRAGAQIAATHHEQWDGSGYPNGLQGEEIPIFGRIVAIADVFDALTTIRPYKSAWPFEEAMSFVVAGAGKQFDPRLVELFRQHEAEVHQIYRCYADTEPVPHSAEHFSLPLAPAPLLSSRSH